MEFISPYIPEIFWYLQEYVINPIKNLEPMKVNKFYWCGGRWTGKTATSISLIYYLSGMFPEMVINAYIIRKEVRQKEESFDDACGLLPWEVEDAKINKNDRTIKFGNTRIECIGLKKTGDQNYRKIGKARRQCHIQILIFDEAFEFQKDEFDEIAMAVGDGSWVIWFGLANPYNIQNHYFQTIMKNSPYDMNKMKRKFHYKKVVGDSLFHWISPLAIWKEPYLKANKKKDLEEMRRKNPKLSDLYLYGSPFEMKGSIYAGGMEYLNRYRELPEHFKTIDTRPFAGVDFGFTIGNTAVIFGYYNQFGQLLIIDELVIDPELEGYDLSKNTFKIISFFKRNFESRPWKNSLIVRCDNDFASVNALNYAAEMRNHAVFDIWRGRKFPLSEKISFRRISDGVDSKKELIIDRIHAVDHCLRQGNFGVLVGKKFQLIQELEGARWKKVSGLVETYKEERVKINDHSINALEYGLAKNIYLIGQDFFKDKFYSRKTKTSGYFSV